MKSFFVPRVYKSSQGCHYPMVEPSIRKPLPYGSIFACFPENPKVLVRGGPFIFNIWVPSWRRPHPPHWVKNLWCRASISSPLQDACLEVRFLLKNPKVCVGGCTKQHDPGALWPPPRPPRLGVHFSKNRPKYKRKRCTLQFKILKPGGSGRA